MSDEKQERCPDCGRVRDTGGFGVEETCRRDRPTLSDVYTAVCYRRSYQRVTAERDAATARALAAERERDEARGIKPELPPFPTTGGGLPRYGLRWNGPQEPLAVPFPDGYWTPFHLADTVREERDAAIAKLAECREDRETTLADALHAERARDKLIVELAAAEAAIKRRGGGE